MIDAGIGANSASGGYNIDNSVKLEADNSEYFNRTPSSNTNRQNFTFSTWVKRTELGQNSRLLHAHQDGQNFFTLGFDTSDRLVLYDIISSVDYGGHYSQRFRDTSAWYHIVFRSETTSGTASTRWKLYVNGVETTAKDTDYGTPPRWYQSNVNRTIDHRVGYNTDGSNGSSQYMAETHFVDGSNLNPTSFGEFDEDSGIWKPIQVSGLTYGTNGFYLDYTDGSDLGNDANGSNNFAENNLTAADQATDTPTNNFCTLNILNATSKNGGGSNEYTEGATKAKTLQTSEMASGTMAVAKGKWYYECKAVLNSDMMAGYGVPNLWGHHSSNPGYDTYSFAVHYVGRVYYYGNSYVDFSPSVSFDTNDIVSVALDADNGFCYWAKNGTWMNGGSPTSGSTGTGGFNYIGGSTGANMEIVDGDFLIPAFRTNYTTNSAVLVNFGGFTTISISSAASDADGYGTFEYAPPSGYYSLCSKNLAEYG